MIQFDLVVDSLNELKDTEMYLFTLNLPKSISGSIYVRENGQSYFYSTIKNDIGGYTLVTE